MSSLMPANHVQAAGVLLHGQASLRISEKTAGGFVSEASKVARENGVNATTKVIDNNRSPVWAITKFADEGKFDLNIVGTRGIGGVEKVLLGSVANGIVRYASSSVLVTR